MCKRPQDLNPIQSVRVLRVLALFRQSLLGGHSPTTNYVPEISYAHIPLINS